PPDEIDQRIEENLERNAVTFPRVKQDVEVAFQRAILTGDGHGVGFRAKKVFTGPDITDILPSTVNSNISHHHAASVNSVGLKYVFKNHRHVAKRDRIARIERFLRLLLVDRAADSPDPHDHHAEMDKVSAI